MDDVESVGHRCACAPFSGWVDDGEGAEGGFRCVVAHFSEEISIYPFFLVERATAHASGQAWRFRHLVGLHDELGGVVVVDRGGVDAGIHAAVPHIKGVGAVQVPVFVGQHHEDAVGGVTGDEGGVVDGDGVGLPGNANQRVSWPYQRHGVGRGDHHGVGHGRRVFFLPPHVAPHAPACHATQQGDEDGQHGHDGDMAGVAGHCTSLWYSVRASKHGQALAA